MAPRVASAYELKQTQKGSFERWDGGSVTFVVDPSVEQAAPGAGKAIASALTAWSGQGGAPLLHVKTGSGGGKVAVDGQNTIVYMPEGYAPAGEALAVTVSTVDEDTGTLLDTDIVINGPYAFAVLAAGARASAGAGISTDGAGDGQPVDGSFDLEHVVSHEIGHALGLADVHNDPHAVMYAFTAPDDASNRAPSADDLQGLDSLYGGPLKRSGCGATIGGSAPGAAWPFLATLAAIATLAMRRRNRTQRC